MSTEFREASLIELHDAKVRVFTTTSMNHNFLGWKEFNGCNDIVEVDGESLDRLATHLGVQIEPFVNETPKGKRFIEALKGYTYPLFRKVTEGIGSGIVNGPSGDQEECRKIEKLWAKPINERLLDIKFTSIYMGESNEESETINITYAGSYTLWWSSD